METLKVDTRVLFDSIFKKNEHSLQIKFISEEILYFW